MHGNPLPKITIVTPSYNQAQFLEETILSVLGQDYPNLEYIVVDGGSTDGSVDLIRKYQGRLAYWVSEPDRGQTHAISKGFDRSTGEILGWLNSDDTYEPGALFAVAECFTRTPEAEVVYGNANMIDASGKKLREIRAVGYSRWALPPLLNMHQASTFWRRSLYHRVGGLNMDYQFGGMDNELFLRFAKASARFLFTRQTLSNFRQHPASKCVASTSEVSADDRRAVRQHFPRLAHPVLYPAYRSVIRLRHLCLLIAQGDIDYVVAGLRRRLRPASPQAQRTS